MASALDEFRFSIANDPKPFERYMPGQRRVKLAPDLSAVTVYWSSLGEHGDCVCGWSQR